MSPRRHEEAARWWFRKETLLVALLRRDAAAGTALRELLRAPAAPAAVPARAPALGASWPGPAAPREEIPTSKPPVGPAGGGDPRAAGRAGLGTAGQELRADKSLCLLPPKGEAGPPPRPGAARATRCRPPACHMPGPRAWHRHTSGDDGGGTALGRCLLGTGIGPWAGGGLDAVDNKKKNNS